jgi:Family of unknown function (DUF5317)
MVGQETTPKAIFGTSGIARDQGRGLPHTPVSAQRRPGYPMSFGALSLLLLVMAASLAIGQLRGGDLDGLRAVHLKALPLAVAALALQVLLGLQGLRLDGALSMIGAVLLVASLLLGLIVVWANRRLPGMLLIGLGLVANLLVVGINGGMPVSKATLERAGISATSPDLGELGPQYVLERPGTRLGVLGARLAVPQGRTMVSVGEVAQYAGLVVLVQGLMLAGTRRRLEAFPARKIAGLGRGALASRNGSAAAPVNDQPSADTGLQVVSAGSKAMLLQVAWLAILLGFLLQLALLLAAAGVGIFAGLRPLVAETARNVGWSVLVCTGVAVGRVAAKGRPPLMGIAGLLAAPLALTIANTIQKGVAAALNLPMAAGRASIWVLVLKAAEYGCLAASLGWIGRRTWAGAPAYGTAGLLAGLVFGGAILTVVAQSAPTPLSTADLMVKGVNELVFPVGCALVIYTAEILGKRVRTPRIQQPPSVPHAKTA